jgi:hypothetical protein
VREATCLTEEDQGYPGGTCTVPCLFPDGCGPGTACGTVDFLCFLTCESDADCRPGYFCVEDTGGDPTPGHTVCRPGRPGAVFGDHCRTDADCAPGYGRCLQSPVTPIEGGYCTRSCDASDPTVCGDEFICFLGVCGGPLCDLSAPSCPRDDFVCTPIGDGRGVCYPGTPAAHLGDSCVFDSDCPPILGVLCRTYPEGSGVTGEGLCASTCTGPADCPAGTECVSPGAPATGWCVPSCQPGITECPPGQTCGPGFLGYPTTGPVCSWGVAADVPVGSPCGPSDCTAGTQSCEERLPNGFCRSPCGPGNSCPPGTACAGLGYGCLVTCAADADCAALPRPEGESAATPYACTGRVEGQELLQGARVCFPHRVGARIGDPCEETADCPLGAGCQRGQPGAVYPELGGYCIDVCTTDLSDDCGPGNRCIRGTCSRACQDDSDCRVAEGYICDDDRVCTSNTR